MYHFPHIFSLSHKRRIPDSREGQRSHPSRLRRLSPSDRGVRSYQRRALCGMEGEEEDHLSLRRRHPYKKATAGMRPRPRKESTGTPSHRDEGVGVREGVKKSGGRQSAKPPVSRYKQSQFPPSVRAAGKDFACATTKRQYSAPGPCDRVVGAKLRRKRMGNEEVTGRGERCGERGIQPGERGRESATFVLRDLPRYFSIKLLGTRRASPPSKLRHRGNYERESERVGPGHNEPRSFSRARAIPPPRAREIFLETARRKRDFVFRRYSRQNAARDSSGWRSGNGNACRVWFLKQRRGYAEYFRI